MIGGWPGLARAAAHPVVSSSGYNAGGSYVPTSVRSAKRSRLAALAAGAQAVSASSPEVAISGLRAWTVRAGPAAPARLVIAIRTSAGFTGYGETQAEPDPDAAAAAAERYAAGLVGQDALAAAAALLSLSSAPRALRGAVGIALLDLRGKVANAPVYEVLAGRTRDKARAMAALPGASEAELLDALAAARGEGYRAFSVPVLLPADTPTRGRQFFAATEALLERLRAAGADDLVLDCGARTTLAEAAGLAARLEKFRLLWLDEPAPKAHGQALAKISGETVTPVGWGRSFASNAEFQDLLRLQAIDVLRPDIGLHGIDGVRRAAALAEAYYVGLAPFHRGGPIGTAAALHVAASVPNFVVQEVAFSLDERTRRMHAAIAAGTAPQVADGFFALPTGPGLGLTVDEDALEAYAA